MANVQFYQGTRAQLNNYPLDLGTIYFIPEERRLYIDTIENSSPKRIPVIGYSGLSFYLRIDTTQIEDNKISLNNYYEATLSNPFSDRDFHEVSLSEILGDNSIIYAGYSYYFDKGVFNKYLGKSNFYIAEVVPNIENGILKTNLVIQQEGFDENLPDVIYLYCYCPNPLPSSFEIPVDYTVYTQTITLYGTKNFNGQWIWNKNEKYYEYNTDFSLEDIDVRNYPFIIKPDDDSLENYMEWDGTIYIKDPSTTEGKIRFYSTSSYAPWFNIEVDIIVFIGEESHVGYWQGKHYYSKKQISENFEWGNSPEPSFKISYSLSDLASPKDWIYNMEKNIDISRTPSIQDNIKIEKNQDEDWVINIVSTKDSSIDKTKFYNFVSIQERLKDYFNINNRQLILSQLSQQTGTPDWVIDELSYSKIYLDGIDITEIGPDTHIIGYFLSQGLSNYLKYYMSVDIDNNWQIHKILYENFERFFIFFKENKLPSLLDCATTQYFDEKTKELIFSGIIDEDNDFWGASSFVQDFNSVQLQNDMSLVSGDNNSDLIILNFPIDDNFDFNSNSSNFLIFNYLGDSIEINDNIKLLEQNTNKEIISHQNLNLNSANQYCAYWNALYDSWILEQFDGNFSKSLMYNLVAPPSLIVPKLSIIQTNGISNMYKMTIPNKNKISSSGKIIDEETGQIQPQNGYWIKSDWGKRSLNDALINFEKDIYMVQITPTNNDKSLTRIAGKHNPVIVPLDNYEEFNKIIECRVYQDGNIYFFAVDSSLPSKDIPIMVIDFK